MCPVTHLLHFELCFAEYSEVSIRCSVLSAEVAAFIIHLINQHAHFAHVLQVFLNPIHVERC